MCSLASKYSKFDNIFENIKSNHENVDISKHESEMPKPSDYRISTMTMITSFNSNINLYVVDKYFVLDDKIISMEYGDKPVKNKKGLKKNKRPFFNQATIKVELNPLKKINVKVFSNGKIQMTGVKKEEDARVSLKMIIDKLKITKGSIPLNKILVKKQLELLLEELDTDIIPDEFFLNGNTLDKLYRIKEFFDVFRYSKIELILDIHKIYFRLYRIYDTKNQKDKTTLELINTLLVKLKQNTIPKEYIYEDKISVKQEEYTLEDLISFKVNLDDIVYSDKIYKYVSENNDIDIFSESIESLDRIRITDIKTVLINSDFNTNFQIRRDELHNILKSKQKYNIISRYEPDIYPGVNNKYYWNNNYKNKKLEGKCYCTLPCDGKGDGYGNGQCKKITIAAFQSGSIIITGANKIEHIRDARNFIIRVLKENYSTIKKIENPFDDLQLPSKKNLKLKYIRPEDTVYINRDSLNNDFNKNILSKTSYLNYLKEHQGKIVI